MESHIKTDVLGKTWGLYGIGATEEVAREQASQGFKSWLNVNTAPLSEEAQQLLASRGVKYHHYPIEVPVNTSVQSGQDLHKIISGLEAPVAIQCATSNRASAVLAIHYGLSQGLDSQKTLAWAASQNLKCMGTAPLRQWISVCTTPVEATHLQGPGKASGLILRQLFEKTSSTYTYLLGCPITREAVLIDPVLETVGRDIELCNALGLRLIGAVNTHVHADHVSGTAALKQKVPGVRSMIAAVSGAVCDVALKEGDRIPFGTRHLSVLSTPGHTDGCLSFVLDDQSMAFTGDALLVRACGRTDFQQGSPEKLWKSIHEKVFTLPPDCVLYTGHDYNGHGCTTVAEEKALNPRLGVGRTLEEFAHIMNNLNLPRPAQIDRAVPANMKDGVEPPAPAPAPAAQ